MNKSKNDYKDLIGCRITDAKIINPYEGKDDEALELRASDGTIFRIYGKPDPWTSNSLDEYPERVVVKKCN